MTDYEIDERIALMLRQSRASAGISREYVASELGLSAKTIQNWEEGLSSPNAKYIIKWFDAVGIPIYPYLLKISTPGLEEINANSSDEQIRDALFALIDSMDISQMRKHYFELFGEHGTAPDGMGEVKTAYLHLPMDVKVGIAEIISTQFLICQAQNRLVQPDKIMPDIQKLQNYIDKAKNAVIEGKSSYL